VVIALPRHGGSVERRSRRVCDTQEKSQVHLQLLPLVEPAETGR